MRNICIYHNNCFDGMASAWVCLRKFGPDTIFYPMNYGDPLYETQRDDQVYMVDFSLKAKELQELAMRVEYLTVIDHHKTAQEELRDFNMSNVTIEFDMEHSGASLAWKYFFGHEYEDGYLPTLIAYIADRDIWRFKLPHSEEINAYIQSFPMDLKEYQKLYEFLESDKGLFLALEGGMSIVRYKNQLVQQIIKNHTIVELLGHKTAVVNCPVLMSEVGHELAKIEGVEFGSYYFDRKDGMTQWGARSIGDFDVSAIAKTLGGGGHKNAAGWQCITEHKS